MAAKDYYGILGLSQDATVEEIKRAYRKIARLTHPDATSDDPVAEERFKDVAKAYACLSDARKRREYDRQFKRVQSVGDLFFHHPAGQETLAVRLPKAEKEEQAGVMTVSVAHVNPTDDHATVTIKKKKNKLSVRLPENVTRTPWCRLPGMGSSGSRGGSDGDHLVLVIGGEESDDA